MIVSWYWAIAQHQAPSPESTAQHLRWTNASHDSLTVRKPTQNRNRNHRSGRVATLMSCSAFSTRGDLLMTGWPAGWAPLETIHLRRCYPLEHQPLCCPVGISYRCADVLFVGRDCFDSYHRICASGFGFPMVFKRNPMISIQLKSQTRRIIRTWGEKSVLTSVAYHSHSAINGHQDTFYKRYPLPEGNDLKASINKGHFWDTRMTSRSPLWNGQRRRNPQSPSSYRQLEVSLSRECDNDLEGDVPLAQRPVGQCVLRVDHEALSRTNRTDVRPQMVNDELTMMNHYVIERQLPTN